MAAFNASARSLDAGVGAVLDEVDALGLRDDTLVICTTDHGMAFPGAKTTLTDRGTGVFLILRGRAGSRAAR
jgi:N-sulfoglucosamine sulfohydrolase